MYQSIQNKDYPASMARPREFDISEALDAATARFWRNGFAATSVRDLQKATGLGPASFYNAFGDKGALFLRCLDRYLETTMRARIRRLEASGDPRGAIEAFFAEIVARSIADRRGCLLVNSALEVAPHDRKVGATVADRLAELEDFFFRCVAAGQSDGTIADTYPARSLARLLLTTVMGLRVLSRAMPDPELLRGAAAQGLALLDPMRKGRKK
jgi:TetR/AcrR family transcriptional repressor of nem operon